MSKKQRPKLRYMDLLLYKAKPIKKNPWLARTRKKVRVVVTMTELAKSIRRAIAIRKSKTQPRLPVDYWVDARVSLDYADYVFTDAEVKKIKKRKIKPVPGRSLHY